MISFQSGEGLTLAELVNWKRQGYHFYRTAHIGNLNLSTLLLGKVGFPIFLHEDIPGDFPGYKPAYMRLHGRDVLLFADPSLNAPCLTKPDWSQAPPLRQTLRFDFMQFHNALALHSVAIRQVVPEALTWSGFLQQNIPLISTFLAALRNAAPEHIFAAYIDRQGHRYKFESYKNDLFVFKRNDHIVTVAGADVVELYLRYVNYLNLAVSNEKNLERVAGLVLSVPLNILLTLCIPQHKMSNPTQTYFHFCGERMFDYLFNDLNEARGNQDLIGRLYTVLASVSPCSNADLSIILIPTTNLARCTTAVALNSFEISQYDLIFDDSVAAATETVLQNCLNTRLFNSI